MGRSVAWRNNGFAKPFYNSKAWQNARGVVLDRSHGLCERCLEKGVVRPADVVHHTTPLNERNVGDPEVSLNPERLIALCDECHTAVHQELGIGAMNGHPPEEPRVGFDEEGNVVRL